MAAVLLGVLLLACVAVPCVFTTRYTDVFVFPKLTVLWGLTAGALLAVATGVATGASTGRRLRWTPAVDVAVAGFVGFNLLAAWFSTDRHQSVFGERLQYQGLLTLLMYVAWFCVARHVCSSATRLVQLHRAIAIGAALVAAYAIAQKAGLDPIWDGFLPDGRVFSAIGQPNALAAYLVLALAPTVFLARTSTGPLRVVAVGLTAEILIAIAFTNSRGGYLGAAVVAGLLVLATLRSRRLQLGAICAVLVLGVGAVVFVPQVRDRIVSNREEGRLSAENHIDSWYVAWRIALDHPLVGTGQETFPEVFPEYSHALLSPARVAYFDQYRVESPHNVFLGVAASTGFPALIAYLGVVGGVAVIGLRAAPRAGAREHRLALEAAVVAVVGHLVTDFFVSAEVTSTWVFWVLMGAVVGSVRRTGTR